jgi:hypothetical protein
MASYVRLLGRSSPARLVPVLQVEPTSGGPLPQGADIDLAVAHYEVERRELAYEHDGSGGLRIKREDWRQIKVIGADAVLTSLTFDSLDEACAYASRDRPGSIRIVRVTSDGEREIAKADHPRVNTPEAARNRKRRTPGRRILG